GVNYFFLSTNQFEEMIEKNEFLEYASYNNCYYGTPAKAAMDRVEEGKICFLIIECQGAKKVMQNCPEAVSIFLMPPSIETLEKRLKKRNTDSEEQIANRLRIAEEEINSSSVFDYIVVNNELEKAVDEINKILNNELEKRNA
ncbi:MAG: guanylate kinase, partial [Eubacterium sp.]|nr:guanylate kinase [Eubacterium sp.]